LLVELGFALLNHIPLSNDQAGEDAKAVEAAWIPHLALAGFGGRGLHHSPAGAPRTTP